jgi:hypothetical protein
MARTHLHQFHDQMDSEPGDVSRPVGETGHYVLETTEEAHALDFLHGKEHVRICGLTACLCRCGKTHLSELIDIPVCRELEDLHSDRDGLVEGSSVHLSEPSLSEETMSAIPLAEPECVEIILACASTARVKQNCGWQ